MAIDDERSDGDRPYVLHHTVDDETPASLAVLHAVCAVENVDPVNAPEELGFTLYDHIDPQALDKLIATDTENGTVCVEFTLENYRMRITDTGRLRVKLRE